jgi:hypothetical protein
MEILTANELKQKKKELENFKKYEKFIEKDVKKLNNVQQIIMNSVTDRRRIIGNSHIEIHDSTDWGSSIDGLSRHVLPNTLEIELDNVLALGLLRNYERKIIHSIMKSASFFKINEDRYKPIFDNFIKTGYKYEDHF